MLFLISLSAGILSSPVLALRLHPAVADVKPPRRVKSVKTRWYDKDDPASHAAAAAERVTRTGGHGIADLEGSLDGPVLPKHSHWCSVCSKGFLMKKEILQHLASKKHKAAEEAAESSWEKWRNSSWFNASVPREVVTAAWSLDHFLHGLPVRSKFQRSAHLSAASSEGMIAPTVMVAALSPVKRAQLWRYLLGLMPDDSLPERIAAVEPRFLRVKELLESNEIVQLIHRALRQGALHGLRGTRSLTTIYDVACGHGLVGLLLAFRFPWLKLVSIDRTRRPAFNAWARVLGIDAEFIEGDFQQQKLVAKLDSNSLVLCVHGCNEVNHEAVHAAQKGGASWAIVPCCVQSELCLEAQYVSRLSDDVAYPLLCGALAAKHNATFVTAVDKRITPRSIVLGGNAL